MATVTTPRKPQYARQRRLAKRATKASNGIVGVSFCPDSSYSDEGFLDNPPSKGHQYFVRLGGDLGKMIDEIWLDDRNGDLADLLADELESIGEAFQATAEEIRGNIARATRKSRKDAPVIDAGKVGAA